MNITVINDCRDQNARMRQTRRIKALTGIMADFCGVACDVEAALDLVDALDAGLGERGVVLVNVAPRHAGVKKTNGSPFCWFRVGETFVVSTLGGRTLSLVRKLGLMESVFVLDLAEAAAEVIADPAARDRAIKSQFRSYDFSPYVATRLLATGDVRAGKVHELPQDELEMLVVRIDCFGNSKTSILAAELEELRPKLLPSVASLTLYQQLREVPEGELAWVVGSSGYGDNRFCELVVGGKGNAAARLGLSVGSRLDEYQPLGQGWFYQVC